jgi:hypothetical protein
VHCAAFLPHEDVPDPILGEEFIVDRENGAAWVAEYELNSEVGQSVNQYLRPAFLD